MENSSLKCLLFLFFVFTAVPSHVCSVKFESMIPKGRDPPALDSTPPPSTASRCSSEQVAIKQEEPEQEAGGAACCLDLIKKENLTLGGIRWPPEVPNVQNQDPRAPLLSGRLDQGKRRDQMMTMIIRGCISVF